MTQFLNWFAMGGYSIYIWPAYSLVCIVLVMNILGLKWQKRINRRKLALWFKKHK